jgi:uncharacterized protein YecT (DUF1311 family)
MPRSIILPAVVAAIVAAAPAAAQETSPYEQCLNGAQAPAAMLACAKTELARQEARLKAADTKLAAMLPAAVKPLYAAANDAWRRFRDAQCAWDRAAAKDDNADFAAIDCKIGMTEARASELDARAAPPDDAPPKK